MSPSIKMINRIHIFAPVADTMFFFRFLYLFLFYIRKNGLKILKRVKVAVMCACPLDYKCPYLSYELQIYWWRNREIKEQTTVLRIKMNKIRYCYSYIVGRLLYVWYLNCPTNLRGGKWDRAKNKWMGIVECNSFNRDEHLMWSIQFKTPLYYRLLSFAWHGTLDPFP